MTMGPYEPVDLRRIRVYSAAQRAHKVEVARQAKLPAAGASAAELLESMPDYLGARELRAVVDAVVAAVQGGHPVVWAMGAHVIKVGCSPIVIDLMERGVISAVAMHGAVAIHDAELAILGATSEEVSDTIRDGSFGMVEETLSFFAAVCEYAQAQDLGLGRATGRLLSVHHGADTSRSVLAAANRLEIPATVHVAIGTDTVHVSGALDGAKLGAASLRDFRTLCSVVSDMGAGGGGGAGGVWLNVGSAVVLPEVFLKAVAVARNLGANLDAMVTANFDMLSHYRPRANVVTRPVSDGNGHEVVGQHEILLPILRQAIIERLNGRGAT